MRKRRIDYSKYFRETQTMKERHDLLDPIRQIGRIQSIAWHCIEGVDPVLNQKLIRVEDVSGTVYEIATYDVWMDTDAKKQQNQTDVSLWLYRLMKTLHDQGLIEKGPCLVEIYQNMSDTVNYLRKKFPYTGQHIFNQYYDGSLVDPWHNPEMIY